MCMRMRSNTGRYADGAFDSPITLAWRKDDNVGAIATFIRLLREFGTKQG